MKTRNLFICIALLLITLCASKVEAQIKVTSDADVILTQHWAMPTLLNPAATGDIDFIRIRGGARLDYFGSHDSPKSFLAAADAPFKLLGKKIGAGVIVNSRSYDLYRNLLISAQGSYKLNIRKSTLSIGLQIGYYHTKFRGSKMLFYNDGDQEEEGEGEPDDENGDFDQGEYPTQDVGAGSFDLALGVRYDHPKFYVAISGQHLTNPKLKLAREGDEATDRYFIESHLPMTMYFDAGGNIALNNSLISLQPSILLGTDFSDFTGVAEMRATYNRKITFGVDYRWNRAVGVVAGIAIKNFYLGYSWEYDYKFHPYGSTGNHELVLGYQLKLDNSGKSNFRQRSIRLM